MKKLHFYEQNFHIRNERTFEKVINIKNIYIYIYNNNNNNNNNNKVLKLVHHFVLNNTILIYFQFVDKVKILFKLLQ